MRSDWPDRDVGALVLFENRRRIPLSKRERDKRQGPFPYWGANGVVDHVDGYIYDETRILVGEDGTVRRDDGRAVVHWATGRFWVNNHAHVLWAKDDSVDPRWLFYALSDVKVDPYITGAVQPKLSMGRLKQIQIPTPPIADQKRIAAVLGALDDKIESNRRLASLLEETAATLFRARFIDFVGVTDLVESEIGPIPRGWRVATVSELVDVNPKVRLAKGQDAPFVEMASVSPWATRPDYVGSRPFSGGSRFEPGDTLLARITGCIEHGKGAFVDFLDQPASGSTEWLVLRARPPLTPEAVFLLSRTDGLRAHLMANMTGSSGRQRVPTDAFGGYRMAVPPDPAFWSELADALRVAFAKTKALWSETKTLAELRDALLPKLVSGEIRVSDAEEVVEAL